MIPTLQQGQLGRAQIAPAAPATDAWASSVLRLHGNGSNGGTTFTDSSPIARTPDSVLATAVTNTGTPKFGSSAINFTGGRIYYADSDDWHFPGDFTIRTWARFNAVGHSGRCFLMGQTDSIGGNGTLAISKTAAGSVYASFAGSAGQQLAFAPGSPLLETWHFIEYARGGNTLYISMDGVMGTPVTVTAGSTLTNRTTKFAVGGVGEYVGGGYGGAYGDRMAGHLADFDVIKGVCLHTTNFTPPTAQLPDS